LAPYRGTELREPERVALGKDRKGMMSLEAKSVALVVTATVHNPSILNPDFLLQNGIVSQDWGTATDFVSIPSFSTLKYPNRGIQLTCQEERLQFEKQLSSDRNFADLVDCASKYVNVLPHVPYRALGINCDFRSVKPRVANWAKERFLSLKLLQENDDISNTRLFFRFDIDTRCRLTIEFRPLIDEQAIRILTNCQYDDLTTLLKLPHRAIEWVISNRF
jgi:hypothetical protein